MRLFKKDEINKIKESERAKEINEGLKLSRRIDGLRELAAREEENITKFKIQSCNEINNEIGALVKKKDALVSEISSLQNKLDALLLSISLERKELDELRKSLDEKDKILSEREERENLKEIDIAVALKNANDSEARNRTIEEQSKRLHEKAFEEKTEATQSLERARLIEERAVKFKNDTEQELMMRDGVLTEREREIKIKEESISDAEKEIAQEKIRLADQRATLERALDRIKQNRL